MADFDQATSSNISKPSIQTLILVDVVVIAVLFSGIAFFERQYALAAITGGLIFFVPNTCFAWMSFRVMGARQIRQVAHRFYQAEMTKFVLTMGLFAYALTQLPSIDRMSLFAAYIVTWLIHQLAAFQILGRPARGNS
ncbi:Uncharacterised protein [BD1-7 clade bacterium]|uniref:ATP synthase protein I n=1 Tax=BD1-7 clade bacterium TaxID=2029982 RepID=A0A5S9QH20_9GAMM|nr:Uncharacterised protein [BD1-7 clade bacterium]CAA0083179.1 Uncharacterised protein [BD1-7 clade bacterium]CAA0116708.1 Uncharacterised protein [BD1-7 clade bacterium]